MLSAACVWITLVLGCSGGAWGRKADSSSALGGIFRTRCAARCLSLHSTRIPAITASHFQSNGSLGWCQGHKQCTKCLEPCKESWELKDGSCRELCEVSTSEERVWLSDVRPGRWYQFRVAAVNVHGTRGYTTPSRHFRSSKDPAPPPAPSELQVKHLSFGPDRSVSVHVSWAAPADLDVPVHHYKLSWSWSVSGAELSTPPKLKRRKTINGDSTSAELEGLRENRSYTLELQAVSYWGQLPLKSSKTTLRFTTYCSEPRTSSVPQKSQSDVLDVGTPFYQDGQLQVRVYWKKRDPTVSRYRVHWFPEFCSHNGSRIQEKLITQDNYASLPGLQFSCTYKVIIQPAGSKGRVQAESTVFYTPSCTSLQGKSPKPILSTAPPKVLARAENLSAAFNVHKGNVTGLFSWVVAMPQSPQQVTGYQVTWAEVTAESRKNNLANSLISQSQILPPERNILVVSGLQLASLYRLEVGVLTSGGQGPTTSRTFQTPGHARPVLQYSKWAKKTKMN
uniref:Anosmin 1a n=1 Tax=Astyanax mexicanus TaxID=7994 RepID=A0A8B9HQI3_ASTMX